MNDPYLQELEKKKNKNYFRFVISEIKAIIDEWDPIGLLEIGAPNDEYSIEISMIAAEYIKKMSDDELTKQIFDIFLKCFGNGTFKKDINACQLIAEKINIRLLNINPENIETNYITYSVKNIIDITSEGLVYKNNEGKKQQIIFEECRSNWINQINAFRKKANRKELEIEESKCVAERNFFAEKPYFEFFSEPNVRFEVDNRHRFWDVHKYYLKKARLKAFRNLQKKIQESGWTTFNLS